mmetsp:Transcript_77053/g.216184  ORF Transcript_77053/g.216184 Transcript_77053/m.216184 type:complete len:328 (+) Transcript_77053:352-1335(+)
MRLPARLQAQPRRQQHVVVHRPLEPGDRRPARGPDRHEDPRDAAVLRGQGHHVPRSRAHARAARWARQGAAEVRPGVPEVRVLAQGGLQSGRGRPHPEGGGDHRRHRARVELQQPRLQGAGPAADAPRRHARGRAGGDGPPLGERAVQQGAGDRGGGGARAGAGAPVPLRLHRRLLRLRSQGARLVPDLPGDVRRDERVLGAAQRGPGARGAVLRLRARAISRALREVEPAEIPGPRGVQVSEPLRRDHAPGHPAARQAAPRAVRQRRPPRETRHHRRLLPAALHLGDPPAHGALGVAASRGLDPVAGQPARRHGPKLLRGGGRVLL